VSATLFQRLLRVLDLEERQGWRNRAVSGGGLRAMAERWQRDAREAGVEKETIDVIVALMSQYGDVPSERRPEVADAIRQVIEGNLAIGSELINLLTHEPAQGLISENEAKRSEVTVAKPGAVAYQVFTDESEAQEIPPPEPTHIARERVRRQQAAKKRNLDDLNAPVTELNGVGPAISEQLARLEIRQIVDLLWHLPVRHEDYSQLRSIAQLEVDEQVTIIANVSKISERKLGPNRAVVLAELSDGSGKMYAQWWNKYVVNQLKPQTTLRFSGKVGLQLGRKTLLSPQFEDLDEEQVATGRIAPVYRLTEGLSNKRLRGFVKAALDEYHALIADPLPEEVCQEYGLPALADALEQVHFPDDMEQWAVAKRRLAFEEFLYIQLGVLQRRQVVHAAEALPLSIDTALLDGFVAALPFPLTGAQQRVLEEVARDLARTRPMTRLVQGDVGSGKTVVAAAAMFVAATNGVQSALLAPTQILAEQHHRGLSKLLDAARRPDGEPVRVVLLTGRVTGAEREQVLGEIASGAADVVVGTTAIIQDKVEFNRLGFAVVDEQHRFGVEQRGALRTKGAHPHLLVMSATPIPRSLALTIYGDLDVSVLDEMPPGRIEIRTKLFTPRDRERLYSYIRGKVREGQQAFIIYSLVEESENMDAGAAVDEYKRLQEEIFPDLRLGLLHGRLSGGEKDEVMRAFAEGEFDVLVSTTVVEVGIDVPNASIIMIEDAERFGLAQLHQLRGRVGRGQLASYCALISKAGGGEAEERLRFLAATNDGFKLAEKDLELRGPGEFLGTRQSGLPELRVAHLSDIATLSEARGAAEKLFAEDSTLESYGPLRVKVEQFWRGHGDIS
jgi:ATP-dependent DNA helicase RecG